MNSSVGRPTHYSDEIVRKSKIYLDSYDELGDALPSVAGLAVYLGRSRTLLHDWAADPDKSEFKDILEQIGATQERVALNKGLRGDYNANLVKLLLGKHGYSERVEQEIGGKGGKPIQYQEVTFVGVNDRSD